MSAPSASPYYDAFRYGMRDHGWVEGKNLVVEYRSADGKPESFPILASDLVRSRVDVILALVPGAVFAAKSATQTIPIVMVAIPDPVAMGLVTSLARPGGNMTGLTTLSADMSVKQLELLKQFAPRATTLAVLSNPTNPWHPHALRLLQTNASTLGVRLLVLSARTPEQCAEAMSEEVLSRSV
jgi:putative ABC transport system substrate-binding protein